MYYVANTPSYHKLPRQKKKKTAKPNAKEIFGMEHSRIRWPYEYKERHKSFINMWIYRKTKQLEWNILESGGLMNIRKDIKAS